MRHLKSTCKLNRTTAHRRCLFANMLKSLIEHGRIQTTIPKAKELRRYADHLVTLAKKNTLHSRRQAVAALMVSFNPLTAKEMRAAKNGDKSSYNTDRQVIDLLFSQIGPRFASRQGGYTRIIKSDKHRIGDNAQTCFIEFLEA